MRQNYTRINYYILWIRFGSLNQSEKDDVLCFYCVLSFTFHCQFIRYRAASRGQAMVDDVSICDHDDFSLTSYLCSKESCELFYSILCYCATMFHKNQINACCIWLLFTSLHLKCIHMGLITHRFPKSMNYCVLSVILLQSGPQASRRSMVTRRVYNGYSTRCSVDLSHCAKYKSQVKCLWCV